MKFIIKIGEKYLFEIYKHPDRDFLLTIEGLPYLLISLEELEKFSIDILDIVDEARGNVSSKTLELCKYMNRSLLKTKERYRIYDKLNMRSPSKKRIKDTIDRVLHKV